MSTNRIPGLGLGNPFDLQLRETIDRKLSEISEGVTNDREEIESLRLEIRKLNRELLSVRRSLGILKKEREQMRILLRTLEVRLQSISGKNSDRSVPEKK